MNRRDELMKLAKANDKDIERKALFHILGSDALYPIVESIYNFEDGYIETNVLGYMDYEIEENLSMGEVWMRRCGVCQSALQEDEEGTCKICCRIPVLSERQEALVKIAFNLYNNYSEGMTSFKSELEKLDRKNRNLVNEAIRIRFGC